MILQAASQILPALLPRDNGQGIFSIFNPQKQRFGPGEKKSIRTKITPLNFVQQGITSILQLNPFTNDNKRKKMQVHQSFKGPSQQGKQMFIQMENLETTEKIIDVGHQICQLFATALGALSSEVNFQDQISMSDSPAAMQVFLKNDTVISGNSQRLIGSSQPIPVIQGCIPVFNGVTIQSLKTQLIGLNPPQISVSNLTKNDLQLSQASYLGSIVWLPSIQISVQQTIGGKICLYAPS